MQSGDTRGLIFDVQGHSIHDGPGTRTLVFLSGCPLRCAWCSNPEGLLPQPRLMYKAQRCKDCPSRCVAACPKHAAQGSLDPGMPIAFHREHCEGCAAQDCVAVCYQQALQTSGRWYTLDEVMRLLNRDRSYWGDEGGVTFTGGEPFFQQDFVLPLLKRCQDASIGACVETSGYVPRATLEAALPLIEWLFVDLKHMDAARHQEATGVSNKPILDNLRWITDSGWTGRLLIRMPVIPGFNDSAEHAAATADFLADLGLPEINLLPFHRLGASKYEQLGMPYAYADQPAPSPQDLALLREVYRKRNIACYLGSDTPF
jgi:pyruvate formate lyase activating enzyme